MRVLNQQQALAMAAGFEKHAKRTRRAEFLAQRNAVVPWRELVARASRHIRAARARARPPVGLKRMLRMYFLQQWFNLSDPGVEGAVRKPEHASFRQHRPWFGAGAGRYRS